jgi:hypothetical protein
MYTHVSKCKNDKRKKRIANRSNFQMKRQPTEWKEILASFHSTGINIKKYQLKKKMPGRGTAPTTKSKDLSLNPTITRKEEGRKDFKT